MSIINNINDKFEQEVVASFILLKVIEYFKGGRDGREVFRDLYLGKNSGISKLFLEIFPEEMTTKDDYGNSQVDALWRMKQEFIKSGKLIQYSYRGKGKNKKKVIAKVLHIDGSVYPTIEVIRADPNKPSSKALASYIEVAEDFNIIESFNNPKIIEIINKNVSKKAINELNVAIEKCYKDEITARDEKMSKYKSGNSLFL